MGFLVQKFGGTSLGSLDLIRAVAAHICDARRAHDLVVVVSAMGGETDALVSSARAVSGGTMPSGSDVDFLLASAEQKSAALLALTLQHMGCSARACSGSDAGIKTTASPQSARIRTVDATLLRHYVDAGIVPIVTGFQGVDDAGCLTTLGRGGSDTTAVALAAALSADACHIYTDVPGVFDADPRIIEAAALKAQIGFSQMLEASDNGAKVLQKQALLIASRYQVPLRVLSREAGGAGTEITYDGLTMDEGLISSMNVQRHCVLVTVRQPLQGSGSGFWLCRALSDMGLDMDQCMRVQGLGYLEMRFVVPEALVPLFDAQKNVWMQRHPELLWSEEVDLSALVLVGSGLKSSPSFFNAFLAFCAREGVVWHYMTRSELKLSFYVDDKDVLDLAHKLYASFIQHYGMFAFSL